MLDNTQDRISLTTPAHSIHLETATLSAALAMQARVIEKRNTTPILANLHFPGDGTMRGTDLDMTLIVVVGPRSDATPFTVALSSLQTAIKGAGKGGLTSLYPDNPGKLTVCSDGLTSITHTLPCEDFPVMDYPGAAPQFECVMDVQAFRNWLGFVTPCVSTEIARYYLNGVYLHPRMGKLCAVATDGHKLGIKDTTCPWVHEEVPDEQSGVILPTKAANVVLAMLDKKSSGSVSLRIHSTRIRIAFGNWVVWTRVIDGTFPDYTRVIPQNCEHDACTDSAKLLKAVVRLGGVCDPDMAKMTIDSVAHEVRVENSGGGTAKMTQGYGCAKGGAVFGMNWKYLKETVEAIDSETVFMAWSNGGPVVFSSDYCPEYDAGLRVVMPMRL